MLSIVLLAFLILFLFINIVQIKNVVYLEKFIDKYFDLKEDFDNEIHLTQHLDLGNLLGALKNPNLSEGARNALVYKGVILLLENMNIGNTDERS